MTIYSDDYQVVIGGASVCPFFIGKYLEFSFICFIFDMLFKIRYDEKENLQTEINQCQDDEY